MTKTIITHASPDFDATAGAWLMIRHAPGFEDAQLEFMPFNAIDRQALAPAAGSGYRSHCPGCRYDVGALK